MISNNLGAWLVYLLVFMVVINIIVYYHRSQMGAGGEVLETNQVRTRTDITPLSEDEIFSEVPESERSDQALAALTQQDWRTAEQVLRAALASQVPGQHWFRADRVEVEPQRDLGITLYHQKRYEEARGFLAKAVEQHKTAKGGYYLELADEALLLAKAPDQAPPTLTIEFPVHHSDIYIPGFETEITGQLKDDLRVVAFYANDARVRVQPGETATYQHTLRGLKEGGNPLKVKAVDLTGKEGLIEQNIVVDLEGPVISINALENTEGKNYLVRGEVSDNNLLGSLEVQGQPSDVYKKQKVSFETKVALAPGHDNIEIVAKDLAGNTSRLVRKPEAPLAAVPDDKQGPEIFEPRQQLAFFTEMAGLKIGARDPAGVSQILIGGKSRPIQAGKMIATRQLVSLEEGPNTIDILAKDTLGNESKVTVTATRYKPAISKIENQMTLAVAPLKIFGASETGIDLASQLEKALAERGRFNLKTGNWGGKPPIEYESQDDPTHVKLSDVAKLAQETGADVMAVGRVEQVGQSINVTLRLVDAKTSTLVGSFDAYDEDRSPATLDYLSRLLAEDLENAYPRLDGKVVSVQGGKIALKFDHPEAVRKTARVVVYQEGEPIVDPDTGENLGAMTEQLAELQVTNVTEKLVTAELLSGKLEGLAVGQKAIIK